MNTLKITTNTGKSVKITTHELLAQFLQFCRDHFAKHSSEIMIGENAKENPEFVITPCKRKTYEN